MPESAPKSRVAWAVLAIELILAVVVIALVGVPLLAESSSAPRFHQAGPTPTPQSVVIGGPTMTPTPRVITTPPPEATSTTPRATSTPFALATRPPIPTAAPLPTAPLPAATTATLPAPGATPPAPTIAPSAALPTVAPAQAVRLDFAAEDWVGGFYSADGQVYGRPWVALYGALSDYPQATLTFSLEQASGGEATLTLTGLDDEWADLNPLSITVNGQEVFNGASPFLNWDGGGNGAGAVWTDFPHTIPAGMLRAGQNEIAVANLTPVDSFNAPPYVLLSTATLEMAPGAGGQETAGVAFTAADWVDGFYQADSQFYGRPWVAVYGALSQYPQAKLRFRLDGQPAANSTLFVSGLDDELAELNPIAIEVNGQVAYSGPSPFDNWDGSTGAAVAWDEVKIVIPPELLQEGRNELTIANLTPVASFNAPPYFLLAEARLDVPGVAVTPLTVPGEAVAPLATDDTSLAPSGAGGGEAEKRQGGKKAKNQGGGKPKKQKGGKKNR